MSIQTIYVKSPTKAAANANLKLGNMVEAWHFDISGAWCEPINSYPVGTVVKFFMKFIDDSPYATAYGNVAKRRDGTVYIK